MARKASNIKPPSETWLNTLLLGAMAHREKGLQLPPTHTLSHGATIERVAKIT